MLILQNITYLHPDKEMLFENISLHINPKHKIALIGNNGTGKSTLLKIMAGILTPSKGGRIADGQLWYVPQHFGQYNEYTVAQALGVACKYKALTAILDGRVTEENLAALDEDWSLEERCREAFAHWQLNDLNLHQQMGSLSGGQKTKVFLAGITIHQPNLVLMDEPSNHLDLESRTQLYEFIRTTSGALVVVSHDRKLLNLLDPVYELDKRGITAYGGNYEFYTAQKALEKEALQQDIHDKEKALRKAKAVERETMERQHKLDARGKKRQEKAGVPTIMLNTLRNNAEKSTAKIKEAHAEKTGNILDELNELRKELPDADQVRFGFDRSQLHSGKILVKTTGINHAYSGTLLWKEPKSLEIRSGERVAIHGANGSGKTTLIRLILGELEPQQGTIEKAGKAVYIDQDYSLVDNTLSVYEQAQRFNQTGLQEHEVKTRLSRFLFDKHRWGQSCSLLSGGEKMRLVLCCLTLSSEGPDLIVLDEPTNNLDIRNVEILTAALSAYKGTLILISHDEYFLQEVQVERIIDLGNQ